MSRESNIPEPRANRRLLRVFVKPACPLCEEALEVLEEARQSCEFEFEQVNILEDLECYQRYRSRIPVGELNGQEVFRYRISIPDLARALSISRSQGDSRAR